MLLKNFCEDISNKRLTKIFVYIFFTITYSIYWARYVIIIKAIIPIHKNELIVRMYLCLNDLSTALSVYLYTTII